MSRPTRNPHASLDRPRVSMVGPNLPKGVRPYGTYTPWQQIMDAVASRPGEWFKLIQEYVNANSAVTSARKNADEMGLDSARLEFATEPSGDKVIVYLRLLPEPEELTMLDEAEERTQEDWRKLEQRLFQDDTRDDEGMVEGEPVPEYTDADFPEVGEDVG